MRAKGKIVRWQDAKGFGFIHPLDGSADVFVHIRSFANRQRRPVEGEIVTYTVELDAQNRKRAGDVVFAGEAHPYEKKQTAIGAGVLLSLLFLTVMGVLASVGRVPVVLLGFYVVLSLITILAYGWDKSAARHNRWRTQENTLHLFSLFGGWPGALIAQKIFRHKTKKQPFQTIFWVTVTVNVAGFFWVLSPLSGNVLRSFFERM
ncbi:MAG: cold shock and DUF1294 domain-containing protein [Halothiobacillus sp.]|jgi:uncharacterized membrane protein YsdA (DUF1294 family)/cold shock CspA family protein|nr:cold shock and DUF1294 domain-containing protein [Halothiobacillus sp.]